MMGTTLEATKKVRLIGREKVAERTYSLTLERPEGFEFIAGQNVDLTLENHQQVEPLGFGRTFSIASAPHQNCLELIARIRDNEYKKTLKELPIGSNFLIDGPYGSFRLHENQDIPSVFLIAGIGITPVLSFFRQLEYENRLKNRRIQLFYINRTEARTACEDELLGYANKYKRFKYIPILTRPERRDRFSCETGRPDIEMLGKYIDDFSRPIFYIVAASNIVWKVVRTLSEKVKREQIRVEDFTGF